MMKYGLKKSFDPNYLLALIYILL